MHYRCKKITELIREAKKGAIMKKQDNKLNFKEAFREYAKKELEFYQNAEKYKVYQRVLPNMQDKTKGMIDFFYNGIIVGGYIDTKINTIVLNKLKVTKFGKEEEVPATISVIEDKIKEAEMVCNNQLK
jgi:hypothetical protein